LRRHQRGQLAQRLGHVTRIPLDSHQHACSASPGRMRVAGDILRSLAFGGSTPAWSERERRPAQQRGQQGLVLQDAAALPQDARLHELGHLHGRATGTLADLVEHGLRIALGRPPRPPPLPAATARFYTGRSD
jgi:hypothetical protein